jgi:hypothetical protein
MATCQFWLCILGPSWAMETVRQQQQQQQRRLTVPRKMMACFRS